MSARPISPGTHSATSSLASEVGASRFASPGGPMKDLFGLDLPPASPSRSRGRNSASMILATSGHNFGASSRSDSLQSSLESRLRVRLRGSPTCEVIWKPWVTPWGQSRWRPRARMLSMPATAFGLWPTMTSNAPAKPGRNEAGNSAGQVAIRKLMFALYPTCRANEGTGSKVPPGRQGGMALKSLVSQAASMPASLTENGGFSLHPEFAGWELGFLPEWLSCAPSGTRSIRVRPPR